MNLLLKPWPRRGFFFCYTWHMHPLWHYVLAVAIVWAVILLIVSRVRPEMLEKFAYVSIGFALGMLAMYIAVHIYSY